MQWNIYNRQGERKYLTAHEIKSFLNAARSREEDVYGFCWVLAVTGCRISEALSLGEANIDFEEKHVVIRCLKKRGKRVFRAVPLPSDLLQKLKQWLKAGILSPERLWPWSRMTGYRRVCEVMRAAGIQGSYATPKGLRHGFAVKAIQSNVPLNLVQRWLGHADIKTTAIYTNAMGPEERELASRVWANPDTRNPDTRSSNRRRRPIPAASSPLDRQAEVEMRPVGLDSCREVVAGEKPEVATGRHEVPATGGFKPRFFQLDSLLPCRLLQFWLFCKQENPSKSWCCSKIDGPSSWPDTLFRNGP